MYYADNSMAKYIRTKPKNRTLGKKHIHETLGKKHIHETLGKKSVKMEPYAKNRHGTIGGGRIRSPECACESPTGALHARRRAAPSPRISLVCESLDPNEWIRTQEVLAGGRKKGRVQIESERRRRRPTPPPTPAPPESP
jgi:hypothetical protein